MSNKLFVPSNKKLTFELATAVIKRVKEEGVLSRGGAKTVDLPVKDNLTGEFVTQTVSVGTVQGWVHRNTLIIGTNKGFGDLFDEAKNDYRLAKKALEDKQLLQRARRNARELLDLDINADGGFVGITSKRDAKTGKRMEVTRYKQKAIGTDPIKLKIKADQTMKILEKLDPAFKKESETTINNNINLSFLSIADREQEMIKLGKIKTT